MLQTNTFFGDEEEILGDDMSNSSYLGSILDDKVIALKNDLWASEISESVTVDDAICSDAEFDDFFNLNIAEI